MPKTDTFASGTTFSTTYAFIPVSDHTNALSPAAGCHSLKRPTSTSMRRYTKESDGSSALTVIGISLRTSI